jgi:hypothetical protein
MGVPSVSSKNGKMRRAFTGAREEILTMVPAGTAARQRPARRRGLGSKLDQETVVTGSILLSGKERGGSDGCPS